MLTSYIAKQTKSLLYFCLLNIVHLLMHGFRIQLIPPANGVVYVFRFCIYSYV